jgi:KDO2-lipid IV(A) lauroyltransferase
MRHSISFRRQIRFRLEYTAASAGYRVLVRLPKQLAFWLAEDFVGRILYFVLVRYRKRTQNHLKRYFPDKDPIRQQKITSRIFRHLAVSAAEYSFYSSGRSGIEIEVDNESGRLIQKIEHQLQPVIFVSPHLGNWEMLLASKAGMNIGTLAIARELDNPWLEKWLNSIRIRNNVVTIPPKRSFKKARTALEEGTCVAYLADRSTKRHSIRTTFMGHPVTTGIGPALLSIRTKRPLVPISLVRKHQALNFRVVVSEPLMISPGESIHDAVFRMTQSYTSVFESWIMAYPEQWLWLHRRWKIKSVLADPVIRSVRNLSGV